MGSDAAGVGHATSGSPTDQLTRSHRMTVDEAQLILNVKRDDAMEQVMKVSTYNVYIRSSLILASQIQELRTPI
jgi:hypothetical protein